MKKIKKHKMLVVAISSIIGIATIFGMLFYNNQFYAQRVIDAIKQENVTQLKVLMESPMGNLNSKPTFWIFEVLSERNELTPLQTACKVGNPEIVEILLESGADVNYMHWDESRNQGSPLTIAAGSLSDQRLQVIKLLMEYGADINYENAIGNDVLSCAIYASFERWDTLEIIEYLEQYGKDIYKKHPRNGNTLLHKACESDSLLVIQYLINDRRFDINAVNADGDTPLICFLRFASSRKLDTLQFLLQSGADTNIKNNEGKTAYDYAAERHPEFVEFLEGQDKTD